MSNDPRNWVALLILIVFAAIVIQRHFGDNTRSGGTSDHDVDPVDFDDYDEDIEFEVTIDGKTRVFGPSMTVWVDSGSEVRLRAKVEPENQHGELSFGSHPDSHRTEWNYDQFVGIDISDVDINHDDEDPYGTRYIRMDSEIDGEMTVDCMFIDTRDDTRYMASVTLVFQSVVAEDETPQSTNLPLVQLEQA